MAKKDVAKTALNALTKDSKGAKQFDDLADKVAKKVVGTDGVKQSHMDKVKKKTAFKTKDGTEQMSKFGSAAWGTLQGAAAAEGRTVLGMAGNHAIRGAAWGAVGGGSMEAMQGGSFWDGAKQGAVTGAVGWTGYRMGMKAVGAKSMNPFGQDGLFKSGSNMYNAFSKNSDVSGQAIAILNNRQVEGIARSVMNQGNKAKAKKKA